MVGIGEVGPSDALAEQRISGEECLVFGNVVCKAAGGVSWDGYYIYCLITEKYSVAVFKNASQ